MLVDTESHNAQLDVTRPVFFSLSLSVSVFLSHFGGGPSILLLI